MEQSLSLEQKKDILKQITFGESIAEREAEQLKKYFIETESWRSFRNGSTDIIFGDKGAGKSAIYTSITGEAYQLFGEGILIVSAENPSGDTAFSSIQSSPPTSEQEFNRLWKLYILVIAVKELHEYGINDDYIKKLYKILEDCNLLPQHNKLAGFIRSCLQFLRPKEVSTTIEFNEATGQYSGQKFALSFDHDTEIDKGIFSIDTTLEYLQKSLEKNNITLWIAVDRLDVAFPENEELECNALKALFKTYLDLIPYKNLKIKIFLRIDIWDRISSTGFREASHLTSRQYIKWDKQGLVNLVVRRILENNILVSTFNIDRDNVLNSFQEQEKLFYLIFPDKIAKGEKQSSTIDWIITRTQDGKGVNTPREIIQLLNCAITNQIKDLDMAINELQGDCLFSGKSIKKALDTISKEKLEQTIYAEYPKIKPLIEDLKGSKAEHTIATLAHKWGVEPTKADENVKQLLRIGILEPMGAAPNLRYKIPFLFRPHLQIIQGQASLGD